MVTKPIQLQPHFIENQELPSTEKHLILKVREGKKPLSASQGIIDERLFKGENKLWAKYDTLWYLAYDSGTIPPALQQRWTKYSYALKAAKEYFNKRNIDVLEG